MGQPPLVDNTPSRREILQSLSAGYLVASFSAVPLLAQEKYPTRPVDFIAPSGPGSGVDQLARFFSPLLEKELRAPFPVLNVQGAVGAAAMAKLVAGRNDGYTIGLYVASMNALVSSGRASWKLTDLAPIARLEKIRPSCSLNRTALTRASMNWPRQRRRSLASLRPRYSARVA